MILAAGVGSRLRPLTDYVPKSLLPVGGRTILQWQLRSLSAAGVSDASVTVVAGHGHEHFSQAVLGRARMIFFSDYLAVNNVGTLGFALTHAEAPVLIVNSDTLFTPGHVTKLLKNHSDSALLYDPLVPPRAEAMKVRMEDHVLQEIAKSLDPTTAHGEYIGLARLGPDASPAVRDACADLVRRRPQSWYEDAFAHVCKRLPIACIDIASDSWIEVDDHEDLRRAASLVQRDGFQ